MSSPQLADHNWALMRILENTEKIKASCEQMSTKLQLLEATVQQHTHQLQHLAQFFGGVAGTMTAPEQQLQQQQHLLQQQQQQQQLQMPFDQQGLTVQQQLLQQFVQQSASGQQQQQHSAPMLSPLSSSSTGPLMPTLPATSTQLQSTSEETPKTSNSANSTRHTLWQGRLLLHPTLYQDAAHPEGAPLFEGYMHSR